MSLPVVILGAGGHARVLLEALRSASRQVAGIVDADPARIGETVMGVLVIGTDEKVFDFRTNEIELVNGIGSVASTAKRVELFAAFKAHGYRFATVVHPSAVIASDAELAEGAQIMAGAVIQAGASIGMNSIVNTRAAVDHDCRIGAGVHIAPGVTLSGDVRVDDDVHIGTGATVIQGVHISGKSVVGAGSVVLRDVPGGVTVYGVPAREARK
ncbi:acetyltransferase [Geotalea uraniireducens]|uniref:Carbonic anhydrase/acetyltransferase isoleucine patch superfamily-like protein n=1 Tax=Geotalea uraniireducens (strain Rf4) TaxID=351605 RepID=A5G8W2_GEOUR|nr:acetyltransferase [Geotalea uraniireducens]ABQ28230.1 Carbonic anhydrase/acetyltransferase isoleucine patch superfamily-like protein [Geotalea uraniireducens Rf4]